MKRVNNDMFDSRADISSRSPLLLLGGGRWRGGGGRGDGGGTG